MEQYKLEEQLKLTHKVFLTEEVHKILKEEKKKQKQNGVKISMAKIICNLIIDKYGENKTINKRASGVN